MELWAFISFLNFYFIIFFLLHRVLRMEAGEKVSGQWVGAGGPTPPPRWGMALPRAPGVATAVKVGRGGSGALRGGASEGRRSAQARGFASDIRV